MKRIGMKLLRLDPTEICVWVDNRQRCLHIVRCGLDTGVVKRNDARATQAYRIMHGCPVTRERPEPYVDVAAAKPE